MKNWLSRTLIREACLRVQDNLETAVEYLPRPRQPGLSGSIRSGVIGSALHQPKWLPFSPASTTLLLIGSDAFSDPGARYGWPKNILYWKSIQESILDLCATVPIHFVIADGIVAMEGNGPLNGIARLLGKIVLADDPVAADATCAQLMGFDPRRIAHIREGSRFLGNASPALIELVGETVNAPATSFQVVPEFRHLRAL